MEKKTKVFLFRLAFGVGFAFLFAAVSAIFINQVYLEQRIEKVAAQSNLLSGKDLSKNSNNLKIQLVPTDEAPHAGTELAPVLLEKNIEKIKSLNLLTTKENQPPSTIITTELTTVEKKTENTEKPKVKKCKTKTCVAPKCRCPSVEIPDELSRNNTPQMIVTAMNDPINAKTSLVFNSLFKSTNVKKCPTKATFFVSNTDTEYSFVEMLYKKDF
nr:uncharacterized protein LOC124806706 [Hydra vulgaris]